MGKSTRKIYVVRQGSDGKFYPYIDSDNGDSTIHEARREAARLNAEQRIYAVCRDADGRHYVYIDPDTDSGMTLEAATAEAERRNNQPEPEQSIESYGIMGIGGIGTYEENEMPQIPTVAQIERQERLERQATCCRRCGRSDVFDGAMFTTLGSSGICDDCV